jgi:iron-siderophore transport system substrate-binding protein
MHPDPSFAISRRRLIGAGLGILATTLVACGDDESAPAGGGTTAGAAPSAFPVTVAHVHGETTIEAAPKRVVSYGYTDADTLLALGVVPVGLLQWIPQWKRGVGSWSVGALGSAKPELYTGNEIDYEGIAKAAPDLISIVNHDIDEAAYTKLSQIAPTVPTVKGYPAYGTPWDVASVQVASSIGRKAQGEALVAKAKDRFAKVRADNPGWEGKQVMIITQAEGGKMFVFADTDTRGRFVSSLGFRQSPEIAKITGKSFYAELSAERFDLLDGDALILLADSTAVAEAVPATFKRLDVVRENRVVTVKDLEVSMALSASTPPAIPFALDRLVPDLRKALA